MPAADHAFHDWLHCSGAGAGDEAAGVAKDAQAWQRPLRPRSITQEGTAAARHSPGLQFLPPPVPCCSDHQSSSRLCERCVNL